jgi:hypothetical protein
MIKGIIIAVIVIACVALAAYHIVPVVIAARKAYKGEGDDSQETEW